MEEKLARWFGEPAIQAKGWSARLFWQLDSAGRPLRLKVDPCELEVFFAAILALPSECHETLEARAPGRAFLIAANARRHELPYFTPAGAQSDKFSAA